MARLDVPDGAGGEAAMIWTLRPELGGMGERMIRGAYQQSILPAEERELARMRIADDPATMDDAFFGRLRGLFTDEEILDLTLCVDV